MLFDLLVIFLLILLNGFFAMSELAVVSARKARLTVRAEAGSRGARTALALASDPATFLASIQIGITSIGVLSGAYGGATLAEPLTEYFRALGFGIESEEAAMAVVVIGVTYLSLTIGELIPKQLALNHAEAIACAVAGPIALLTRLTRPLVVVLNLSNRVVMRVLCIREKSSASVTEEEVKAVIAEGMHSGALEHGEREILDRIIKLADFDIRAIMTHRQDTVWLDVKEPLEGILKKIETTRHSHFLLCDGSIDRPVGLVLVKDILLQVGSSKPLDLRAIKHKPMYLPDSVSILDALEEFKQSTSSFAVLVDEHGVLQGIVTLKDMLEAVIGTLPEPAHRGDYGGTQRADGSWLLDGGLSILEAEEMIGISGLAGEDATIHTVAGLVLAHLSRLPRAGDHFTWRDARFEVMDMDGIRVDKVLVSFQ